MQYSLRRYQDTGQDHVNEQIGLFDFLIAAGDSERFQIIILPPESHGKMLQVYPCDDRSKNIRATFSSFSTGEYLFFFDSNSKLLGYVSDPDQFFYFVVTDTSVTKIYAIVAKSKDDAEKELMKVIVGVCFFVVAALAASTLDTFYANVNNLIYGEVMRVRVGAPHGTPLPPLCQVQLPLDCKERGAQSASEVLAIMVMAYWDVRIWPKTFSSQRLLDSLDAIEVCPRSKKLNEIKNQKDVAEVCLCATNVVQCAWAGIKMFIPWMIALALALVSALFWCCLMIAQNS